MEKRVIAFERKDVVRPAGEPVLARPAKRVLFYSSGQKSHFGPVKRVFSRPGPSKRVFSRTECQKTHFSESFQKAELGTCSEATFLSFFEFARILVPAGVHLPVHPSVYLHPAEHSAIYSVSSAARCVIFSTRSGRIRWYPEPLFTAPKR